MTAALSMNAFKRFWLAGGGSGHGFKHGPAIGEISDRADNRNRHSGTSLLVEQQEHASKQDGFLESPFRDSTLPIINANVQSADERYRKKIWTPAGR